jgi:3-isopropylmalate/(R)-2-methylmalate dehydratase large subunit
LSLQAFDGLRQARPNVHAPEKTLAVIDHNVPTTDRTKGIEDEASRIQVGTLARNAKTSASNTMTSGTCGRELCK